MKKRSFFCVIIIAFMLSGCSVMQKNDSEYDKAEKTVYAMDTVMNITAYGPNAKAAVDCAEEEIFIYDSLFRRGSDAGDIYNINKNGEAVVSADTVKLIKKALDICDSTDGAFDISIAPVMDLWGFYNKEYCVPSKTEISDVILNVNYKNIKVYGNSVSVSKNSRIDLGGIAKGFLSERIMEIYCENGVESGIVSLGGNVQTLGTKPDNSKWRVAVQDPDDSNSYIGFLSVSDMAVVTSGSYQRFFEKDGMIYHHIIDPKTGYPVNNGLASVTIVCADGTLADGLSTALFVMGIDRGIKYWQAHKNFDAIFVNTDGKIYITKGLKNIFESKRGYSIIDGE